MPGRQHCIRTFGHCKSSMHSLGSSGFLENFCAVPFMGTSSSDGPDMCLMHLTSVWITVSLFVNLLPCPHLKYHPCDEVSKVIMFIPILIQTARFVFQLCVVCICSHRVCMYACECIHTLTHLFFMCMCSHGMCMYAFRCTHM